MSTRCLHSAGLQKLGIWLSGLWGRRGGVRFPDHTYIHQQCEAFQEVKKSHGILGITTSRTATQEHSEGIIDLSLNPSSDWGEPVSPTAHVTPELPCYPKRGYFLASDILPIKNINALIEKCKNKTWQSVPSCKDGLCIIQQVFNVKSSAWCLHFFLHKTPSYFWKELWCFWQFHLFFLIYLTYFWIQLKVFTSIIYCGSELHRLTICDIKGHFLYYNSFKFIAF